MNQHQFNRPSHSAKFHKALLSKKKKEPDLTNVGVDFKIDSPSIVPPEGVFSGDLVEAL